MRWLWLILFSISVKAQQPFTIIVDQTLGQPVYPFDEGPSGFYNMLSLLEAAENRVIPIVDKLDSAIASPQNKILILTPTINRSYKPETIKNIQQFVKNGGNLLVFTEHENYYNNSIELNRITEEFGIKTMPDGYKKGPELKDVWLKAKCPKYKLNDVIFYFAATLQLSKNAQKLASIDTATVAATATYGLGKVAVLSDYEMAWNFATNDKPSNGLFLMALFKDFFKCDYTLWQYVMWDYVIPNKKNNSTIICEGNTALYPTIGTLGLANPKPNDTLMIYCFGSKDLFFSAKDTTAKYLLIADGSSNFWLPIQTMGGQYILDELKYEEKETNTNKAAAQFGLHFGQKTLVDTCINSYKITLQPGNQKASCVGYIDTLQTGHFTVVYTANATAVDYNAPLGGEEYSPNYCYANIANKQQYIVALYNKRVFAIADMELFQNIKSNPYLLKAFQDWINLR